MTAYELWLEVMGLETVAEVIEVAKEAPCNNWIGHLPGTPPSTNAAALEYQSRLKEVGYRLVFRPKETASLWVMGVGEDQRQKFTTPGWYVVRKADGMLLEWDLREVPRND